MRPCKVSPAAWVRVLTGAQWGRAVVSQVVHNAVVSLSVRLGGRGQHVLQGQAKTHEPSRWQVWAGGLQPHSSACTPHLDSPLLAGSCSPGLALGPLVQLGQLHLLFLTAPGGLLLWRLEPRAQSSTSHLMFQGLRGWGHPEARGQWGGPERPPGPRPAPRAASGARPRRSRAAGGCQGSRTQASRGWC